MVAQLGCDFSGALLALLGRHRLTGGGVLGPVLELIAVQPTGYENLGEVEKARACYASILEQAQEYAEARSRLARIAHSDGDLKQARAELERARDAAPENIPVATHYAEICVLLDDLDTAVGAWKEVGMLQLGNPEPFEIIGRIEEKRRRWEEAGIAYRECIQRTNEPRRDLLLKFAEAYGQVGKREHVLEVYLNILERAPGGPVPSLGDDLRNEMLEKLRDLGYVRRRGEWIAKKHVFPERGWIYISDNVWVRPEEARLREVADRIEEEQDGELRTLDDANYSRRQREEHLKGNEPS